MSSSASPPASPTGPVLVYDGTCGYCADSVQLILKHDQKRLLRFAAREGEFGRAVLRRHPELANVDSVLWVVPAGEDPGSELVLTRSAAAMQVAAYLGGVWRAARVARLMPRSLRDAVYQFVARHRHDLPSTGTACLVPPPEQRSRFLP